MLCDELKQEFTQIHVSRRLPRRVHGCTSSVDVDIVRSENLKISEHEVFGDLIDKHEVVGTVDMQTIDRNKSVKKHVRSDGENRCSDDDVS